MASVLTRIVLRYLAAMLVAKGLLTSDMTDVFVTDPDILAAAEIAIGVVIGAVAEGWYYLARRLGWET